MAIELRAIPVSLDADNNLTVAMSDPSDRHAVDEISFFTGAYVVRAVATQMQIAWCLAHYYGHVTNLGERLMEETLGAKPRPKTDSNPPARPRTRADSGKVAPARHKAVAPGESTDVARPSGQILDPKKKPLPSILDEAKPAPADVSGPVVSLDEVGGVEVNAEEPEQEITIEAEEGGAYEPVLEVAVGESRPIPKRRKPAKEDPPELAARAGEVQLATGTMRAIDFDEARIIVADNLEERDSRLARQVSGEVPIRTHRDRPPSDEIPPSVFVQLGQLEPGIIYDELEEELSRPVRASDPTPLGDIEDDDFDDVV